MTAGTTVYTVRIPTELYDECLSYVVRRNQSRLGKQWTFSDLIRAALVEKLGHADRGLKSKSGAASDENTAQ